MEPYDFVTLQVTLLQTIVNTSIRMQMLILGMAMPLITLPVLLEP